MVVLNFMVDSKLISSLEGSNNSKLPCYKVDTSFYNVILVAKFRDREILECISTDFLTSYLLFMH